MERYHSIEQAAALLNMSTRYVRRLVAERRIPFHRLGRSIRIAESDLAAFAAARRVETIDRLGIRRDARRVA